MILKASDLSETEVNEYIQKIQRLLMFQLMSPSETFDSNGLRFPLSYLREIGVRVILLPLEYMVDYADVITKSNVDNRDDSFTSQIIDLLGYYTAENVLKTGNATSIGNLAYLCMYSHNPTVKKLTETLLTEILNTLIKIGSS